jgi:hypothetical protein
MRFHLPLAVFAATSQLAPVVAKPIFEHEANQKPLLQAAAESDKYTIRAQSDEICDAGSRQWTGWIRISDEKRLFFCKLSY